MNRKKRIHAFRCDMARRRQPQHDSDLAALCAAMAPADHPYRGGDPDCFSRLLDVAAFRCPSKGCLATLPTTHYLFHVRSLEGFLSCVTLKSRPQNPALKGADETINMSAFVTFMETEMRRGATWVPLISVATGFYESAVSDDSNQRRLISWWTDREIDPSTVRRDLHRAGVPDTWTSDHSVLVRCTLDDELRQDVRIPSVLDGFASHIFVPCRAAPGAVTGTAIDVGSDPLSRGLNEVVLGPVAVGRLAIRLIEIPRSADLPDHVDADDPSFLRRLETYYRGLPP